MFWNICFIYWSLFIDRFDREFGYMFWYRLEEEEFCCILRGLCILFGFVYFFYIYIVDIVCYDYYKFCYSLFSYLVLFILIYN